jgi:hypothetical protein
VISFQAISQSIVSTLISFSNAVPSLLKPSTSLKINFDLPISYC